MTYKISNIPADKIQHIWLDVQPYIENVLTHCNDDISLNDIFDNLISNKQWLVVVIKDKILKAVFVCSIHQYHNKKVFFINLAAGEDIMQWRDDIIQFMISGAKAMNCNMIEWRGRQGFMKIFKDVMKIKHVSMIYDLEQV